MATLEIEGLGKTYFGGVQAVSDVSASIADGEFIVLVGPSGCGKSTILRMIAGLETITDGELRIDDRLVNNVEPGDRNIAMVFQNYALYPHMSVRRNMEYGLRNEGLPKPEIESRVTEAARMLRLGDYLDRKPRQLSGGQRQRVAMGRAIVRDPKVFLFDEPLSNLDAKLRTQLRSELKTLHQRLKATFVYVTHDQVEAMSLADRIIIMNAGKVEQIGRPMDLYRQPATRFVADFIGSPSMNLFVGTIDTDGQFRSEDGKGHVHLGAGQNDRNARRLEIGIRPEHLVLSDPTAARLGLDVAFTERLGADTLVHGHLTDTEIPLTVRLDGGSTQQDWSGTVHLGFDINHMHMFDPDTGQRLTHG